MSINSYGELTTKGSISYSTSPSGTYIPFGVSGYTNPTAWVMYTSGALYYRGGLYQNQGSLSPPSNAVKFGFNTASPTLAYIDSSGNIYLAGTATANSNP